MLHNTWNDMCNRNTVSQNEFSICYCDAAGIMQIETYTAMLTWKFSMKVIEGIVIAKRLIKILNPDRDFISPISICRFINGIADFHLDVTCSIDRHIGDGVPTRDRIPHTRDRNVRQYESMTDVYSIRARSIAHTAQIMKSGHYRRGEYVRPPF